MDEVVVGLGVRMTPSHSGSGGGWDGGGLGGPNEPLALCWGAEGLCMGWWAGRGGRNGWGMGGGVESGPSRSIGERRGVGCAGGGPRDQRWGGWGVMGSPPPPRLRPSP